MEAGKGSGQLFLRLLTPARDYFAVVARKVAGAV